jgi:radical SAM protein with 4Fe4S-binding SPASM domain
MRSHHRVMSGPEFTAVEIEEAVARKRLLSMELEFDRACNFRCAYCYAGTPLPGATLATAEIHDIVAQAQDLGARKIIVLGGEPMLRPDILEILAWLRSRKLAVELFTNGTNMTPGTAARCFDLQIAVVLKLNSFQPEIQNRMAGYAAAHATIQSALANLQAAGYPSADARLGISSVICQPNRDEVVALWTWARDRGIEPYLERMNPMERAVENLDWLALPPKEMEAIFGTIARIDRERYGREWLPQPPLVGNHCLRHKFSCLVNAAGDVMPCVGVNIAVGNVRQARLADILRDSEVIADLRDHGNTIKGPCATCEQGEECYGCRGTAHQMTGDYLGSDPLCWRNHGRGEEIFKLPIAAGPFVPHEPPMLVISRLLEVGERWAAAEAAVPLDAPYLLDDGRVDEAVYIEMIAQAAAGTHAFRTFRQRDSVRKGALIGVKKLVISGTARAGDCLRIEVRKIILFNDFGVIEGRVSNRNQLIASATLKVYHNVLETGDA